MTNFDVARDALETSLNSSGSAMAEHAKWSESLEARLNKLKSTWQSLSQTFMKSDFLKSVLDATIGLVDGLDKLIDTFGLLPTLATGFAVFKSFKGEGMFKVVEDEAAASGKRIQSIFGQALSGIGKNAIFSFDIGFEASLNDDIVALQNYIAKLQQGVSTQEAFNQTMRQASATAQQYAQTMNTTTISVSQFETMARQDQITKQASSFRNAKALIKEYNGGLQTCKLTQTQFISAVGKSNTNFAKYLSGLNGAKASMGDYIISLIGAKVATFALEAASMAMNAALTMGISLIISGIVSAITKWMNAEEELAEKVDEVTSSFKEQQGALVKNRGTFESQANRYVKLAQGVDRLGRNVSLTADEYSEYQNIVNSIGDQVPSLVAGYDEQGNAILNVKNNVEELTAAYDKLIKAQNNEILVKNASDIKKDFENVVHKANNSDFFNTRLTRDSAKFLKEIYQNNYTDKDSISDLYADNYDFGNAQIYNALKNAGVDISVFDNVWKVLADTQKTDPELVKSIIDGFNTNLETEAQGMKTIAEATLSNAIDISSSEYYDMNEAMKGVAKQVVASFDYEFFAELQEEGKNVQTYINDMLSDLNSIDEDLINNLFDLESKFNKGEISYGAYLEGVDELNRDIQKHVSDPKVRKAIRSNVGYNDAYEEYNSMKSFLKRKYGEAARDKVVTESLAIKEPNKPFGFTEELSEEEKAIEEKIDNFLKGLSQHELTAVINLKDEIDWVNSSPEEILAQIEEEAEIIETISFTVDLNVETANLENLNSAITQSLSGVGLGVDSEGNSFVSVVEGMFGELDSYDPSKLFERTANGIRLNSEELRKLNDEYKTKNIANFDKKMDALGKEYFKTREELSDLTYGTDEYNKKAAELDNIEAQINATETLAAQYRGLASAYNAWQMAESAGSQRDMYEGMIEGLENVDDELSRGWLDDGTIEFLRLIYGETLPALATTKELQQAYKDLDKTIEHTSYSVRDFFTVDEDGNSTNAGVYNFLDAIGQMEEEKFGGKDVVKRDKKGNIIGFDFQIVGGDKAIAEALGISEELVQIMVRAADDAGFVVSMDGTYQQLDILKEKAQKAANALKDIFGKTTYEFDLNTSKATGEGSIEEQYKEALKIWETYAKNKNTDGTIDMSVEGAEEAFTLVSTLQSMVDKLSEPIYMKLDATQVEKDMQTPLSKLQEYERLVQQENQLVLKGTDTSSIDAAQDDILDYFENLNPEIKAQLGIDGDSREEIQRKLESGEIEIPATIDLQVEMNDTLRDMVNIALYNAGLIDGEELTKRVDIKLYANEVDTEAVEEEVDNKIEQEDTKEKNIEIIAEVTGCENVKDLSSNMDELDDKTIQAVAEVFGRADVESLKDILSDLSMKDEFALSVIAEAIGQGDVQMLQQGIALLDDKTVQAIAKAFGYESVDELQEAISNMDGKTVKAIAKALGIEDVESLINVITNLQGKTVDAKVNTDGQKEKINTLQGWINNLKGKVVNIRTNIIENVASGGKTKVDQRTGADPDGKGGVNGTANVNGTSGHAFKQGSWGTKNSGTALVGELGREVLVRGGRYYTIGDNGAEFIKYKKGDIIFNHVQSDQLFRNGKVTAGGGRAKALVNGTAFAGGSTGLFGIGKVVEKVEKVKKVVEKNVETALKDNKKSNSSGSGNSKGSGGVGKAGGSSASSNKSSSGSSSKSKDEFEETIDWIETAISRIEREIDKLDKKANNVYKSWSERNKALTNEIGEVRDEIELQQSAYNRYLEEANSVGLSESWAKKVRNGEIDIDTITDEDLADKIKNYQDFYEKALDCQDAIEELKETEAELYQQRFDNVSAQYEGILGVIEHEKNMLDEYISQSEAQGHLVSANYYNALIDNERKNNAELIKQRADMLDKLEEGMKSGTITRGSQAWYEMVNAVDETTLAIEESNTALLEYNQTLQQLSWETFDMLQEKISNVTDEANFLIDLMSSDKLYDDNGQLTDKGMSTMGLHGQNYNTYMYQADQYAKEVAKLNAELAKDPYDQELINRRDEMLELQRDSILAAEQEKDAIRDMVEEGIELELDALQERIDKHNEALDSQRELYDYQKKVKEQTKEIASLEKQMTAYQGDDSEEAKQKLQKISVELESARQDLEETEYEKFISDSKALLDELYLEYETILNTRLDNIDALISDMITEINNDSVVIGDTIRESADSVGYTLSDSMQTIWNNSTTSMTNVITTYGDKFTNAQTTTNSALNTININLQSMIGQLNKIAKTNVKSASTSSAANSSQANATPKPQSKPTPTPTPTTPTIKVGGKINASGAKIYDYAGDTSGERQLYRNDPIYKILKTDGNWLQVRWHKLTSGITGWFKKGDVKAYATGTKRIMSDNMAWTQEKGREFIVRPSDGAILTPLAKNDSVLNANASNNIWDMANSPAEFIKDNLNLGVANVPNNSNVQNNYTQHLDNVVFSFPNVKNYDELLSAMQKDKNFERLVLSMSIDRLAGKSSLAKGKSIR